MSRQCFKSPIDTPQIVAQAKKTYPVSVNFRGQLAETAFNKLSEFCRIYIVFVYADGASYYHVRYRGEPVAE